MRVILKVNPIQIGLSKGLSKVRGWEGAYKKASAPTGNLEKGFKDVSKILKLSISSIKFH